MASDDMFNGGSPSSSDSESETDYANDSSEVDMGLDGDDAAVGVRPYNFEPRAPALAHPRVEVEDAGDVEQQAEQLQVGAGPLIPVQQAGRLGNANWCRCGNCLPMPKEEESVCCQEVAECAGRAGEDGVGCLVQHEGFEPVCLNIHVLQTAYYQYRQQYGAMQVSLEERYRYTAYRQLVRWCWGYLGKEYRVPIPSCCVNKIRETFQSEHYTGFRYADE